MANNPRHASMFHWIDNDLGYCQCVISEDKKSDFESLGFVDNVSKLVKPTLLERIVEAPVKRGRNKDVSDNKE